MTDARRSDRQQTSDEWTAMVASKAARREPVRYHTNELVEMEARAVLHTGAPGFLVVLAPEYDALADRLAEVERERDKWKNWTPDDTALAELQEQAKGLSSKAATLVYIQALQARLADAQATIARLEQLDHRWTRAEINELEQQVANMTARKDAAYLERNQAVAALAKCNDGPTDVTTAILTDRGQKYGAYIEQAQTAQRLKRILADVVATRVTPIRSDAAESMQMICTKLSRLVHGDPEHLDSWDDIAGYARLVADRLRGVER